MFIFKGVSFKLLFKPKFTMEMIINLSTLKYFNVSILLNNTHTSLTSSSPVQDVMSTPHFQLKRLRKELVHEGDVRDELEKELANQIKLEKDHKAALLELQEKNESLLHRVHEVLKQCQYLKTDNSQKERKIDELTEENGTLTAQVRYFAKLTLAHELAETEWKSRKDFLEKELNEAVTQRDCLSEQVQILLGKISVLEDELQKAKSQEKGEVLGPILEWEELKQELADLTLKLAQLQDTIFRLEKEKAEVETLLAEERGSFEKETKRLQMAVFDLEQSINNIRLERETLQEALWTQKEMLTAQISLTAEIKISADLRQQREELEGKVASLDKMVNALHTEIQGLEVERASQQDALNALIVDLQSARATIQEYEQKLEEHQKVVQENESLKNEAYEEIRNLRNDYDSVDHELKLVKEQNIEINKMIKSNRKEHEDTVKKLQQELDSASSVASEKQEEMLVLSAEVTSLKEQICHYSENEVQKQQKLSFLEAQHNALKENMTSIQNQLAEVTATASQKESELHLLQQELCHQETLREKAQELEKARCEELERTVSELQATILQVTSLVSEREACLSSLQDEMKDQQLRANQCEDDLRNELKEKVGNLHELLDTANRDASDKDRLLQSLNQKLKQVELLCQQKEKDVVEMHQAKEDLEKKIIEQKQQLDECQQNLEMLRKERDQFSAKVSSLQEEICRSQQEVSLLQADHNVLKENLAALQNQLVEVTTRVSKKESELLLLQQELSHQETLKEKALELETIKREEFEKKVSELQAKILEVSTIASRREAQVISLQSEMKDQQSLAKQSKEDLRRELEEKVGTLQGELDMVNRCAADKEKLLGSLDQKLKEMEGLFLQKDKDVLEMHQAKEELEKRIVKLHVEKQELSECQQNLEILRIERDHLSTEVTSLNNEIQNYQEDEVQKQQEISVLEAERNTFKENMDALEKKLVEETTAASQKQSELVLLKDKLHQLESLIEKTQELETAKREELERMVSELQVKILEVSTLASERDACVNSLQDQLTDQLKAKQSEDDLRRVLKEKVETLQGQLETASRNVSDKDQLLQTLDQKLKQMDLLCQQREKDVLDMHQVKDDLEKKIGEFVVEKQQLLEYQQNLEMVRNERAILSTEVNSLKDEIRNYQEIEQETSFLETERNTLKHNLAALKTQVVELTTTASQKESELLLLQKEVCDKEKLKEKAQELEKDISELQAKILEVSTFASEREAQISYLKDEINDQQLSAKQSENDLRRVLEEKIETLQKQLETTSCDIMDKDHLLESLDQKLTQMKLNCQQKEKDVLEIQHSKEDLEKRIGELLVEKQQKLEEYQQNLETVRKERDYLSVEVTSLKDEIRNYQEDEVQKQQEISVLEAEHNTFKENMDGLEKKLVEETTAVSNMVFHGTHAASLYIFSQFGSCSAVLGESSTPLVRSSERLAAKRRALGAESLETLYFTPLSQQESSITSIGDLVVDSAKLTASARRRRTTQVINITMAKVGNESFSSLHSARSQPNLAVQHSRPFSMDLSEESAVATLSKADTFQSLPGYRRSTVHNVGPPRGENTFCIGAENEPEHAADDWMRIAELQTRNKACLPHLKSSYPLESRPSLGPSFTITDEDLRMGDPHETIRRASVMPGQILESLNSRRFSLAPSSSQSSANSQPQRATMLPGQIRSSTAAHRAAQLTKTSSRASENKRSPLAPKRPGSQLRGPDTPEVQENKCQFRKKKKKCIIF
uniref:Nuclear mitotic apparatus protein 1 n=1 Tax=Sinocyclocheilus grahami TaxID=75366 RepID=A0A672PAE6_SINGR